MSDMTFEALFEHLQRLSLNERLRMAELLISTVQTDLEMPDDWQAELRATYGILADDPIERPPQLPLEEREELE